MGAVNLSKQTVNLSKGELVNLSKSSEGLKKVMIGLGWDEAEKGYVTEKYIRQPGIIGRLLGQKPVEAERQVYVGNSDSIDCDAWVALMHDGKFSGNVSDIVYYGSLIWKNKSGDIVIQHHGDNLTGEGDGDDEEISIDLSKIPSEYNCILVGVTIYRGLEKSQSFDMIKNTFVRIVDEKDGFEICRYNQADMAGAPGAITFIAGELYKDKGEWQFKAMGEGNKDRDISVAANRFRYKN